MNEAAKQALRDISDDYTGVRQTYYTDSNNVKCIDTWFVGGSYLYNVENRALNRSVGASYLNNGGYRLPSNKGLPSYVVGFDAAEGKDMGVTQVNIVSNPICGWVVFSEGLKKEFNKDKK